MLLMFRLTLYLCISLSLSNNDNDNDNAVPVGPLVVFLNPQEGQEGCGLHVVDVQIDPVPALRRPYFVHISLSNKTDDDSISKYKQTDMIFAWKVNNFELWTKRGENGFYE